MNPLLQKLVGEPIGAVAGASPIAEKKTVVQKMEYSHQAMAAIIAANPFISQNELAAIFGYSPAWVSRIKNTEMFQHILAEAMKDSPFTPEILANRRGRIESLMDRSLEVLEEKMNLAIKEIPDQLAIQTFKATSGALQDRAPILAPPGEVQRGLEELGKNLVGLLRKGKQEAIAVDAEVVQ